MLPAVGERLPLTVKVPADIAGPVNIATVTAPVNAPLGTETISELAVAVNTVARVPPPNNTLLLFKVVLKLVPVMVTVVPAAPVAGVNPITVGSLPLTVKAPGDIAAPLNVATENAPVVAPLGTVTVSELAVAAVTVALMPPQIERCCLQGWC